MNLFGYEISFGKSAIAGTATPEKDARSLENPSTPINNQTLSDLGAINTSSGVSVTPTTSMRASAVYACVRVIAETIASLPLQVYLGNEQGKTVAYGRQEYKVLHDAPSPIMTSYTFFQTQMANVLLSGNAYAEIEWANNGQVRALWPIAPSRVTPKVSADGVKTYRVRLNNGEVIIKDEDMLHIPGLGFDGISGFSPIAMMRQSVGLALATEEFGARLFNNGLKPSGVLSHPKNLSDPALQRLKQSLAEQHSGLNNAHKTLILEEDMKYTQTSISPDDAQFLETRKFQVREIARIFRVPPHLIADLEQATFSNIEQQSLEFVTYTLRPWLVAWEQEINRKIFARNSSYFAEFNVDALLRGDLKSRYDAYAVGRNWGWLTVNDILRKENMNTVDDGDERLRPLNMTPAGQPVEPTKTPQEDLKNAA